MNDAEVIAHQARRIAELEVELGRSRDAERQLLAMLQRAGIKVHQVELTQNEAQLLDNFRRATPEGKAAIRAKLESLAPQAIKKSAEAKAPSRNMAASQVIPAHPLPAAFFKGSAAA